MEMHVHRPGENEQIHYGTFERERVSFLVRFIANTLAIVVSASIFDSVTVDSLMYAIVAGLIFTVVNAFLKVFLVVISLPLIILTFGLFYPLINVALLNIVDYLMGSHFDITGFMTYLGMTIIIAIINYAVSNIKK